MDPHSTSAVFSFNYLGALLLSLLFLLLSAVSKAFDMGLLDFNRSSSLKQFAEQEIELPKSLIEICEGDAMEFLLRELHLLRLFFVFLYFFWTLSFAPRLLMPETMDVWLRTLIFVAYFIVAYSGLACFL
mgnify:CR=1 FL=1